MGKKEVCAKSDILAKQFKKRCPKFDTKDLVCNDGCRVVFDLKKREWWSTECKKRGKK